MLLRNFLYVAIRITKVKFISRNFIECIHILWINNFTNKRGSGVRIYIDRTILQYTSLYNFVFINQLLSNNSNIDSYSWLPYTILPILIAVI